MNKQTTRILICFAVFGLLAFVLGFKYRDSYIKYHIKIIPVSTRQRLLYHRGYLPYDEIDGICGNRTHAAQKQYEHDQINESIILIFEKLEREDREKYGIPNNRNR